MCAQILSQYYLELYVTQDIAFILVRNSKWNVENDLIYSISSIFLSFVFAFLIHSVFQMINTIIKKIDSGINSFDTDLLQQYMW